MTSFSYMQVGLKFLPTENRPCSNVWFGTEVTLQNIQICLQFGRSNNNNTTSNPLELWRDSGILNLDRVRESKQFRNIRINCSRRRGGSPSVGDVTLLVDKELFEIPLAIGWFNFSVRCER